MANATSQTARNFRQENMSETNSLSDLTLDFLDRHYRGSPHAAARVAQITRSTKRTVTNWLARLNGPSLDHFGALLEEHPELEAEMLEHLEQRRALRDRSRAAAERSRARLAQRP